MENKLNDNEALLENYLLRKENLELKLKCKIYQDAIETILSKTEMTKLLKHKDVHDTMHNFMKRDFHTDALMSLSDILRNKQLIIITINGIIDDCDDDVKTKMLKLLEILEG